MPISAFQQLQGVPASGAATQGGGDPNMLIEALPYLLAMLGSAVSPDGSPIQQIANQVGNLAQRKAVTQYIARKKVDPKTPPPLGLSPEIQMQVDNAIAQENAMKFQQEMAIEMQKMEQQRTQSEIETNKGQIGVAQTRAKTEQEASLADVEYKKNMLELQKSQNAAQQDYLKNKINLDQMLAAGELSKQEYNKQLGALDAASRLYAAGLDTEEIGNTFGSTFDKLGVNFDKPPVQNVPPPVSSASVPANNNVSNLEPSRFGNLFNPDMTPFLNNLFQGAKSLFPVSNNTNDLIPRVINNPNHPIVKFGQMLPTSLQEEYAKLFGIRR